jgi:hypothetical protein
MWELSVGTADLAPTFVPVNPEMPDEEMSGRNGHIGIWRQEMNDVLLFGG